MSLGLVFVLLIQSIILAVALERYLALVFDWDD